MQKELKGEKRPLTAQAVRKHFPHVNRFMRATSCTASSQHTLTRQLLFKSGKRKQGQASEKTRQRTEQLGTPCHLHVHVPQAPERGGAPRGKQSGGSAPNSRSPGPQAGSRPPARQRFRPTREGSRSCRPVSTPPFSRQLGELPLPASSWYVSLVRLLLSVPRVHYQDGFLGTFPIASFAQSF